MQNNSSSPYATWFTQLKQYDLEFWRQPNNTKSLPQDVNPSSVNFYGEIFFLTVLKLKNMVLFSSIYDEQVMIRYRKEVLEKCNSFQLFPILKMDCIVNPVYSANESNYKGLFVLYEDNERPITMVIKKLLFDNTLDKKHYKVTEKWFSKLLNYPVSLPEDQEMEQIINGAVDYRMAEIEYSDCSSNPPIVVTTYGGRMKTNELQAIRDHFQRYKQGCEPYFNLEVHIREL
jgi:hypothetical protein